MLFSETIGSPLKNRNCLCKSTEMHAEWHGLRDGCVTHRQPKPKRRDFWSLDETHLQQSFIIASHACTHTQKRVFCPPLLWSECKEPIEVRWYSRAQPPNWFDWEQYASWCFSLDAMPFRGKEFSGRTWLPEWGAFKPTTSASRLPSDGQRQNYWGTQWFLFVC